MKIILLLLAPLLLHIPNNRVDISWLDGRWKGLGYQPDGIEKTWSVDLTCNTEKEDFTIQYPSLDCSGSWTIVESFENRIVFREKIKKGLDKCVPTGVIIVTRINDNYISYSYFIERYGKQYLSSFSTLKRIS
ncbi:MAG: hypothetical protein MK212_20685 [Saprospiraceae bacterium]|nr:hypothetical protein [Saprospiraceae bacterium]